MSFERLPAWPELLDAYIASRSRTPFEFGPNDCARFANGAVLAMTNANLMAAMRYNSARGAARILKREGGLRAALARRLPEISPARAQRGDVGLVQVQTPTGLALAACVVLGDKLAAPGPAGVTYLARAHLRAAFKV